MKDRLVLLPGLDGTGQLFDALLAAWSGPPAPQVLRYPSDHPLDYDDLVGWVNERLPVDRGYVLVGESFSGPIALRVAAQRPPHLRGLVLVCTFVQCPRPTLRLLAPLIGALPLHRAPAWALSQALLNHGPGSALAQQLHGAVHSVDEAVLKHRLRAVAGIDVRAQAEQVEVPTLILSARHDRLVPASAARTLKRLVRHSRLESLVGPHALLQAQPQACAALIESFARG